MECLSKEQNKGLELLRQHLGDTALSVVERLKKEHNLDALSRLSDDNINSFLNRYASGNVTKNKIVSVNKNDGNDIGNKLIHTESSQFINWSDQVLEKRAISIYDTMLGSEADYKMHFKNRIFDFSFIKDDSREDAIKHIRSIIGEIDEEYDNQIKNTIDYFNEEAAKGTHRSQLNTTGIVLYENKDNGSTHHYDENVFRTIVDAIGYHEGTKIMRYSELADEGHPMHNIYDAKVAGDDPYIVFHNYNPYGPMEGPLEYSILTFEHSLTKNYVIGSVNDNLFVDYIPNRPEIKGDPSAEAYGITLTNDSHSLNILKAGILSLKINSEREARLKNVIHIGASEKDAQVKITSAAEMRRNMRGIGKIDGLMEDLDGDIASLFHEDNYGKAPSLDDYKRSLVDMMRSTDSESRLTQGQIDKVMKSIEHNDNTVMLDVIKERMARLMNNYGSDTEKLISDEEWKLLSRIRSAINNYSRVVVDMEMKNYKQTFLNQWAYSKEVTQNPVLAYFYKVYRDSAKEVSDKYMRWNGNKFNENNKDTFAYHIKNVIKAYDKNNKTGSIISKIAARIPNTAEKVWDRLVVKKEMRIDGTDEVRLVPNGEIYWDIKDPEVQAKIAAHELTKEEVEAGKFIADTVDKYIKEVYRHLLLRDPYTNRKGVYKIQETENGALERVVDYDVLERAVENMYAKNWKRGRIPYLNTIGSETLARGDVKEGVFKISREESEWSNLFPEMIKSRKGDFSENFRSRFSDQYFSSDKWYDKMGFVRSANGTTLKRNGQRLVIENASFDIERILNNFVMDALEKQVMENKILPAYNDAVVMSKELSINKEWDDTHTMKQLKQYYDRVVLGQRQHMKNAQGLERALTIGKSYVSFHFMFGNLAVPVTSAAANAAENLSFSLSNFFGNPMNAYTTKESYKARLWLAKGENRKLADKLFNVMQVYDRDKYTHLNSARYKMSNRSAVSGHTANIFNWTTDMAARMQVMTSQMLHDGVIDAVSLDKEDNVVYDATKDRRIFNADGTQTEKQKIFMQGLRQRLLEDARYANKQRDSELPIMPYDKTEERRFEAIANEMIIGVYNTEAMQDYSDYVAMTTVLQFKNFMATKLHQRIGAKKKLKNAGWWDTVQNEKGEWENVYVEPYMEGYWRTFFDVATTGAYKNIKKLLRGEKVDKLNELQRHNLAHTALDLMFIAIASSAVMAIMALTDEDDKEKALKNSRFTRSINNGLLTAMSVAPSELFKQFNNIPVVTQMMDMYKISTGAASAHVVKRSLPLYSVTNTFNDFTDIFTDENE